MKIQVIFFMLTFYILYVQAEQEYRQPVQITIDARTGSSLDQNNNTKQQAKHTSNFENDFNGLNNGTEKPLKPTVSALNYTLRNGAKVLLVTTGAKTLPSWITATYLINRFVICNYIIETPFIESATKEEVTELAAQRKYKVPEPIIFPLAHYIYNYCKK